MYNSISTHFHYESIIQKSRFIVDIFPINSEEEAKLLLQEIRKKYYDATHHCSAYRLYPEALREHSSDDGEPAGTAGKPMLNVLQHRDLVQVLAIVTRYFGGIKLGTGGLVRAYGGTLSEALDAALAEHLLVRHSPHALFQLTIPYDLLGVMENDWQDRPYIIQERTFSEAVTITIAIPENEAVTFSTRVTELSAARIQIESLGITSIASPIKP